MGLNIRQDQTTSIDSVSDQTSPDASEVISEDQKVEETSAPEDNGVERNKGCLGRAESMRSIRSKLRGDKEQEKGAQSRVARTRRGAGMIKSNQVPGEDLQDRPKLI